MAYAIVSHGIVLKKGTKRKINLATKKQEVSMDQWMLDVVTAEQRMTVPFRFKLYKFKTWFFGMFSFKGVTI